MPEYMEAIFREFLAAADAPALKGKLTTSRLPPEKLAEQISKLRGLRKYGFGPVPMIGSRFLVRFKDGDQVVLCVQTENAGNSAIDALESTLGMYGAIPTIVEESTFLFMAYEFAGFYRPKAVNLSPQTANDIVGIAEALDYSGHDIGDLIEYFERVSLFIVPADSVLATSGETWISALCAASDPQFRTGLIRQDDVAGYMNLLSIGNINPENIYYALTSVHWKHAFLEIYKCLEALYYLPWVLKLKNAVGQIGDGYGLSRKLRDSLKWREKEKDSIQALFLLIDEPTIRFAPLAGISAFRGIDIASGKIETVAERIYKIRNIQVHQEDYYDNAPIAIDESCWPVILDFLIAVVGRLYNQHSVDANFSYLLEIAPEE